MKQYPPRKRTRKTREEGKERARSRDAHFWHDRRFLRNKFAKHARFKRLDVVQEHKNYPAILLEI